MRVLHIITALRAGGAEQQLRQLLRHLPPEVECDVVTLTRPGLVADGLRADGIRVLHLGMGGNRDLRALPRLVRLIRTGGYDIVHTHLYRACLYGRIAARLAGVRAVVASEHSLSGTELEGRRLTAGVRALYLLGERLGRVTIAVSPTGAEDLRAWGCPHHASASSRSASTRPCSGSTTCAARRPGCTTGCRRTRMSSAASAG